MPKSISNEMLLGPQRNAMAELCIRLVECIRNDYFPGVKTCEAFELIVIVHRMFDMHAVGRSASASALARSTGIPRSTVQRRMSQLKLMGVVEPRGPRFLLSVSYMNKPNIFQGYKRRVDMLEHTPEKLLGVGKLT
jgi:Winged helix-turn-helix DNA-binding